MLRIIPLILFLFFTSLFSSDKLNVFILHSYSQEYPWTKGQHEGFVKNLQSLGQEIEFNVEYLNTKKIDFTDNYSSYMFTYLQYKYQNTQPDLIYVTDDNALLFMLQHHNKLFNTKKEIPVFFSGVNDLSKEETLKNEPFKGVFEVKEIEPNIQLIKQFSPQTHDIYFLGDNSSTYKMIQNEIKKNEKKFETMRFHYISASTIEELKAQLPTQTRSFVLLTTIGEIKGKDGHTLLPYQTVKELQKNKHIILMSTEDCYIYPGVIGGYVTNANQQGKEAAELVKQYITTHNINKVHSLTKSQNIYLFDALAIRKARIILSEYIARNATIINNPDTLSLDNANKHLTLGTIILSIIVVVGLVLFLIIFRRRRLNAYETLLRKHESLKSRLYLKERMLTNIYKISNIGIWRIDEENKKIYLSKNLLKTLEIDSNIYKNDIDTINHFIHLESKELYFSQLEHLKRTHQPVTFEHKMVSLHKKIFNVKHLIYEEGKGSFTPNTIVGVIYFENI